MPQLTSGAPVRPQSPLAPEELAGDLIQSGNPLFGMIWINRERMSGTPCFAGTRVPVQNLFDYLGGGEPLSEFIEDFPGVTREQCEAVIALAASALLQQLPRA